MGLMKCVLLFFVSVVVIVYAQHGAINLKRDLFQNYDSQSRPVENSSTVVNVCVGLYILQIVGLNEKSQVRALFFYSLTKY